MSIRIACINAEPASRYREKGYATEQLEAYYNPNSVADDVCVFAHGDEDWDLSQRVRVVGFHSLPELTDKALAYKPNVVRCYGGFHPSAEYALLVAMQMNVPSYLSLHDYRVQYRSALARFSAITAYTETIVTAAKHNLQRDVELQLNGIDSRLISPRKPFHVDPRVNDAKYRVFTISRNDPIKNIKTNMDATRIVAQQLGSLAHVIAGEGTEDIPFDGVHLGVGNLEQDMVCEYLNWAQCFLQLQLVADIGKAATEALMVGRPVIHTGDASGNAILHIDSENGILVPREKAEDAEHVAGALRSCLSRDYDYGRIRQRAIETYDADMQQRREADRYRRLAAMENPYGDFEIRQQALRQLATELKSGEMKTRLKRRLRNARRRFLQRFRMHRQETASPGE